MSVSSVFEWLHGRARQRSGVRAFQLCIGLALLVRSATEAPFAAWLWGPEGLGQGSSAVMLGSAAWLVDWVYRSSLAVHLVVAMQAFAGLLLVTGRATRLGAALGLAALSVLEWRTMEINDGGDNLCRLALGYMLLTVPARRPVEGGSTRAYVHNLGVVLLVAQVLILYLTAGLSKAMGEVWTNGTALYVISQVEEFSLPGLRAAFTIPIVTVGASYATLLWQVTFPIGVFSRFKLAYVAIGLFFHLGIAVFMGLVSFSLVMLGAELLLVDDDEYAAIAGRMRAGLASLRRRWT